MMPQYRSKCDSPLDANPIKYRGGGLSPLDANPTKYRSRTHSPLEKYPSYRDAYFGSFYNNIAKINLRSFTLDSILTTTDSDFRSLDYDPITDRLFAASLSSPGGPRLYVIDCNTFTVESIIGLASYTTFAFGIGDYPNRILYVLGYGYGIGANFVILRIDMDSLAVLDMTPYPISLYLTNNPTGMRAIDSNYLYLSTNGWGVHRVNKTTMAHEGRVTPGTYAGAGRNTVDESNHYLYVGDTIWNRIYKINTLTWTVSATLTLSIGGTIGIQWDSMDIDLVNGKLYAANYTTVVNSRVYKIDLGTFTEESAAPINASTRALLFVSNEYTGKVYCDSIQKLETTPLGVEAEISPLGLSAQSVAVT